MSILKVANVHFDSIGTKSIQANGTSVTINTSDVEKFRFDESGNLLIGRADSTVGQNVKLDIVGAINASGIFVDGTPFSGGAKGGGNDQIFWENGQNVTANYTISIGRNAGTFGPITINANVVITVPANSTWSVV